MASPKQDRLAEIYRLLKGSPPASSAAEALTLLTQVMNRVEDERSGVPFDPANWQNDGRLYPPQPDSARAVDARPDLTRYRSKRHNTFVRSNGALEIHSLDGTVEFSKMGADGKGIDL